MSNYLRPSLNPKTKLVEEEAEWLDDYYGHHQYGVRFQDGTVFTEREVIEAEKANADTVRRDN